MTQTQQTSQHSYCFAGTYRVMQHHGSVILLPKSLPDSELQDDEPATEAMPTEFELGQNYWF